MAFDPKLLLETLQEQNVEYVLIGGLAATLQGTTRLTKDVDIVYARSAANLARLCNAMNRFNPRRMVLGQPAGDVLRLTPEILREERVVSLATDAGQIDLLDLPAGFASFGAVRKFSEAKDVGGLHITMLTIDGLIRSKETLKRPKDVQDVVELKALKEVEAAASPE